MKGISGMLIVWLVGLYSFGEVKKNSFFEKTPTGFYYSTGKKISAQGEPGYGEFGNTYARDGYWHPGLDIRGKEDDPVYAIADGEVVKISPDGWSDEGRKDNFAYLVCHTLSDGKKFVAIYGHLRRPWTLKEGDPVVGRQEIGLLGPLSEINGGPHLHFGIYQDRDKPDSCNYSSPYGYRPISRPAGKIIDGVLAYDNWFDPVVFIEKRNPFISKLGSAIAVVMDRSGSMEGEKLVGAKRAAESFFAGLNPSDYSCLVSFSDTALTDIGLIQATPGNKIMLQAVAGKIGAGGATNIGAGLTHGFVQLSVAKNSISKAALLMSDGQHNAGELWPSVEEYEKKGWPIYTVAYGADADQKTLSEIARRTGGTFFPAGLPNIAQVYHKISAHMHKESVLFSYNDLISQGKQLSYQVAIDPDIQSTTFFVDWQGSTVDLHLVTPDGKEIKPDNFSKIQGITYQQGPTYCFYRVQNPKAGNWKAVLLGKLIGKVKEQVNFTVSGLSPFLTNILGFQPEYQANQHFNVSVKASNSFEGDKEALKDIKVTAEVKKPSPNLKEMLKRNVIDLGAFIRHALYKTQRLKLHDNGQQGDFEGNDGVFTSIYKDADTNGAYVVTVSIEAKRANGEKVIRTLKESIQIGPIESRVVTLADFLGIRR